MKRTTPAALLLGLCLLAVLSAPGQASAGNGPAAKNGLVTKGVPTIGAALPAMNLPDVAGRRHSLGGKGRPVALLFFCGCAPCHDFARLWSQVQQGGELQGGGLTPKASGRAPVAHDPATVVVFLGGAGAARAFAAQTGLDLSQTLLLLDPSDRAGQKFGVIQCPRVFVTDGTRRLVYTSPDDPAPRLSAPALVSRTLTVWRHLNGEKKAAPGKKAAP